MYGATKNLITMKKFTDILVLLIVVLLVSTVIIGAYLVLRILGFSVVLSAFIAVIYGYTITWAIKY